MPGRACVPGRKPLGVGRRAMATSSTSSASARASPIRCRVSPKAPRRGAGSRRPGSTAPASLVQTMRLSANGRWLGRPKLQHIGWRACDVRTLTRWLSRDVLALAGPDLATRQVLFDFIADELERLEPEDARRIHPVRVALRNQRDDLLAFAGVLDTKLAGIARTFEISLSHVREACVLHR